MSCSPASRIVNAISAARIKRPRVVYLTARGPVFYSDFVLPHTAGRLQQRSGHPPRIIRGEECHHGRNVIWLSDPAEGRALDHALLEIAALYTPRLEAFRHHWPWVHGIHADLLRSKFLRQYPSDRVHCTLGAAVDGGRGRGLLARDGSDVDHTTALRREQSNARLGGQQQALYIGVEETVDLLFPDCLKRLKLVNARVVHEYVHLAVSLLGFGKKLVDLRSLCHTAAHRDGLAARLGDLRDHLLRSLFARSVVHHYRCALRGQFLRDSSADPLRCSGHHRHFPCKLRHLLYLISMSVE